MQFETPFRNRSRFFLQSWRWWREISQMSPGRGRDLRGWCMCARSALYLVEYRTSSMRCKNKHSKTTAHPEGRKMFFWQRLKSLVPVSSACKWNVDLRSQFFCAAASGRIVSDQGWPVRHPLWQWLWARHECSPTHESRWNFWFCPFVPGSMHGTGMTSVWSSRVEPQSPRWYRCHDRLFTCNTLAGGIIKIAIGWGQMYISRIERSQELTRMVDRPQSIWRLPQLGRVNLRRQPFMHPGAAQLRLRPHSQKHPQESRSKQLDFLD